MAVTGPMPGICCKRWVPETHSENDLQTALIRHIKAFILELGGDFIFMGEQFRLQVGNQDFYIDLLFYHRGLSALVPFFSYNIDTRETLKQTSDEMETNN